MNIDVIDPNDIGVFFQFNGKTVFLRRQRPTNLGEIDVTLNLFKDEISRIICPEERRAKIFAMMTA